MLSTIIIGLILLLTVILIITKLIKDKKEGKTNCSCGCGSSTCCNKNCNIVRPRLKTTTKNP